MERAVSLLGCGVFLYYSHAFGMGLFLHSVDRGLIILCSILSGGYGARGFCELVLLRGGKKRLW